MTETAKVIRVLTDAEVDLGCRLLEGDEEVLRDILKEYAPVVGRVIQGRFPSFREQDVQDILSIALDRLWQTRTSYDDRKSSLKSWFCLIAASVAKDVLKSGWYRARSLEVSTGQEVFEQCLAVGDTSDASPPTPQRAKLACDLKEILDRLPDYHYRIMLAWAEAGDGVWTTDLAQERDVPAATIRVTRLRVLEKIKTELRRRGHSIP